VTDEVEGKNNRIQTIMCAGYGYRNVPGLVPRILGTHHGMPVARREDSPDSLASDVLFRSFPGSQYAHGAQDTSGYGATA